MVPKLTKNPLADKSLFLTVSPSMVSRAVEALKRPARTNPALRELLEQLEGNGACVCNAHAASLEEEGGLEDVAFEFVFHGGNYSESLRDLRSCRSV